MKQTAVEWLIEKQIDAGIGLPKEWRKQAKAMEKEQIIDARIDGDTYSTAIKEMRTEYAELYYKETFNANE